MSDTIFAKIVKKEIPADIVYEDDQCLAFNDINAQAPTHILVIPKKVIPKLEDAAETDRQLLGHLLQIASKLGADAGGEEGFRVVINNGAHSGQTVFHLHLHVLAGRRFAWPPG